MLNELSPEEIEELLSQYPPQPGVTMLQNKPLATHDWSNDPVGGGAAQMTPSDVFGQSRAVPTPKIDVVPYEGGGGAISNTGGAGFSPETYDRIKAEYEKRQKALAELSKPAYPDPIAEMGRRQSETQPQLPLPQEAFGRPAPTPLAASNLPTFGENAMPQIGNPEVDAMRNEMDSFKHTPNRNVAGMTLEQIVLPPRLAALTGEHYGWKTPGPLTMRGKTYPAGSIFAGRNLLPFPPEGNATPVPASPRAVRRPAAPVRRPVPIAKPGISSPFPIPNDWGRQHALDAAKSAAQGQTRTLPEPGTRTLNPNPKLKTSALPELDPALERAMGNLAGVLRMAIAMSKQRDSGVQTPNVSTGVRG